MITDRILTGIMFVCLALIMAAGFARVYAVLYYGATCDLWTCQ